MALWQSWQACLVPLHVHPYLPPRWAAGGPSTRFLKPHVLVPAQKSAQVLTALGGSVGSRVTPRTTVLIVAPNPDGPKLNRKESQAKELLALGYPIRLLSEAEYHAWVGQAQNL